MAAAAVKVHSTRLHPPIMNEHWARCWLSSSRAISEDQITIFVFFSKWSRGIAPLFLFRIIQRLDTNPPQPSTIPHAQHTHSITRL